MSPTRTNETIERSLIFLLRVSIGWFFLWAAIHHFGDDAYVGGFLSHTKTFHPLYGALAQSPALPVIAFMVEYGHMLIGLSLISGLLVRASAPFGILIMMTYWTAHMDLPYIENVNSFIIDYHPVFAVVLGLLILRRAGHIFGLDGLIANWRMVQQTTSLRWLTASSPAAR
jgi:thiosulfate dehydrogenase [quinone] large subunit